MSTMIGDAPGTAPPNNRSGCTAYCRGDALYLSFKFGSAPRESSLGVR